MITFGFGLNFGKFENPNKSLNFEDVFKEKNPQISKSKTIGITSFMSSYRTNLGINSS